MSPTLLDLHGRALRLGEKLGDGGEGAVFRLQDQPNTAVKVFAAPLAADRVRKIEQLVRLGSTDGRAPVAAWPSGLAFDRAGIARGLLLPVVEKSKDIHHLYTPGSRRLSFPKADFRLLLHVATNLARAFATIHQLGLVIGDVNPGLTLVAADGTVRLIDVDSFQVPMPSGEVLLCRVGVPMFQPPKLQAASFDRVIRTVNHDAFGLAVTIFQLLMLGRHPYAGRYSGSGEMPIETAIEQHRFAYGAAAASFGMSRPPNTVGLELLPAPVTQLFEEAFASSALRSARPTASTWVTALSDLRTKLTTCRVNQSHFYSKHLAHCPWCTLEQQSGALLFGVPHMAASSRGRQAEHEDLKRRLHLIGAPWPLLVPAAPEPAASAAATKASQVSAGAWVGYTLAAVMVLAGVLLAPMGLLLVLTGAIGAGITHVGLRQRREPIRAEVRAAEAAHQLALAELVAANYFPAFHAARAQAQKASAQLDQLPAMRATGLEQLQAARRTEQLAAMLSTRLIEDAQIAGIGPVRAATLAAYGITTAADVSVRAVLQVPTFGEVMAYRLASWRQSLESSFTFDPSRPIDPLAISMLDKSVSTAEAKALMELRGSIGRMDAAMKVEPARAEEAAARLRNAQKRLAQAKADVAKLGGRPGVAP